MTRGQLAMKDPADEAAATALANTFAGDWPVVAFPPPRLVWIPTEARRQQYLIDVALNLVYSAGLVLDPWEEYVLTESLAQKPDGTWAALEVGICVPRQNGKGAVLEARELIGAFIDAEKFPTVAARLTMHSAHEAKTAHEQFERLQDLILDNRNLRSKLRGNASRAMRQSEGGESINLLDGRRIRFRTRTSGGGRGLSGDVLVFDEAMILSETMHRAVWPIITARPNPQIFYAGSAVDQLEPQMGEHGLVFSRVRDRGQKGDPDLAYFEWSLGAETPGDVTEAQAADPESWAAANPNLDRRLSRRVIAVEQRSMSPRGFAVERLGVGDWPDPRGRRAVIDRDRWDSLLDQNSVIQDPACLAFDVSPDRVWSAVSAAGWDQHGRVKVEVINHDRGTAWVGETLEALRKKNRPLAIVCNGRAATALLPALEADHDLRTHSGPGLPYGRIVPTTAGEHAEGCGIFYDAVEQEVLRHHGDQRLDAAIAGAIKRPLADSWAWDKKGSAVDITPLIAATGAVWGLWEYRGRSPQVHSFSEEDLREAERHPSETPPPGLPPLTAEDLA